MNESNEMRGRLTLWLTDRRGERHAEQRCDNRIVTSGRLLVAQLFGGVSAGTPPSKVTHMAVGTGGDDPADAQAGLLAEVARNPISDVQYTQFVEAAAGDPTARARGGLELVPVAATSRVRVSLKAVFDFAEANSATPLREAGIFTAPSGGVMYNRVKFADVTKTNAFQLTLLWDVVF